MSTDKVEEGGGTTITTTTRVRKRWLCGYGNNTGGADGRPWVEINSPLFIGFLEGAARESRGALMDLFSLVACKRQCGP